MPELADPRREKFAQLLAADRRSRPKKSRWHREAGFSGDSGNACVMSQEPEIMARVAELRAQVPVEQVEVMPPEIEAVKGGKVTRESMTADIDLRILKAEQAGEWPTVAALTATRAKLHGLLLQEQAVAADKSMSLLALAQSLILPLQWALDRRGTTAAELVVRMLGIVDPKDLASLGVRPKSNGHAKV